MKNNFLKRMLSIALAAAMALSITACGGDAEPVSSGGAVADGVKDNLTIGVTALWATLSPFQGANGQWSNFPRTIYDRLGVFYNGECVKQAAESWEVADDGVTWTVKIRDNIVDTAGNKITADDVVWFIQESITRAMKSQFNKISSVEKLDDLTFQLVLKSDIVDSFDLIMASTYMVSKAAFESSGDEFANTVVATGPYEVVEFVSGSHLTLKRRTDYWDVGNETPIFQCNAKNVTYKVISEPSQQQVALETGTIDAFETLTSSLVPNFENNSDFGIISGYANNGIEMYFSGDETRSVAKDENLRKAICHAIDIDGLIAGALEGRADPMYDPAAKTLLGYLEKWEQEEYFPYDVDKAKEYLAKSNYSGETLSLMSISVGSYSKVCQMIQGYLLAIGINCDLNLLDNALFSASLFDGTQYDMILVSAGGMTIPNLWSNRFDMNAHEKGDSTCRRDETLTNMIYDTWTQDGFTEENIDAVHVYLKEHCIAYGLYLPWYDSTYRTGSGITDAPVGADGNADFVAATFK